MEEKKKFLVGDEYRTNPLSVEPGGTTVTVIEADGSKMDYDKVKNPWSYARAVLSRRGEAVKSIMWGHTDLAKVIREGGAKDDSSPKGDSGPKDDDDGLPF
jgi:hypothetical protein